MKVRDLVRLTGILVAYSNPLYVVPAIIMGSLVHQLIRDPNGDPEKDAHLFFELVPGAPITFPRVAYGLVENAVSTRLRQREARKAARKRLKLRADALLLLKLKFLAGGIPCGTDDTDGILWAEIVESNVDAFERAVYEVLLEFEGKLPPGAILSRMRPNALFDEDWLDRRNFVQRHAA